MLKIALILLLINHSLQSCERRQPLPLRKKTFPEDAFPLLEKLPSNSRSRTLKSPPTTTPAARAIKATNPQPVDATQRAVPLTRVDITLLKQALKWQRNLENEQEQRELERKNKQRKQEIDFAERQQRIQQTIAASAAKEAAQLQSNFKTLRSNASTNFKSKMVEFNNAARHFTTVTSYDPVAGHWAMLGLASQLCQSRFDIHNYLNRFTLRVTEEIQTPLENKGLPYQQVYVKELLSLPQDSYDFPVISALFESKQSGSSAPVYAVSCYRYSKKHLPIIHHPFNIFSAPINNLTFKDYPINQPEYLLKFYGAPIKSTSTLDRAQFDIPVTKTKSSDIKKIIISADVMEEEALIASKTICCKNLKLRKSISDQTVYAANYTESSYRGRIDGSLKIQCAPPSDENPGDFSITFTPSSGCCLIQ